MTIGKIDYVDVQTGAAHTLTRDEWKRRCADQYIKRGGLDQADAMAAAEACLGVVLEGTPMYADESPEDMANGDMDCWTDDE